MNFGTDAPRIFKSLVEATCFGAKAIVDRFNQQGVPVKGLIGLGGVAKKSSYIMQTMADVMDMPIRIHKSEQTCAAGAAMFAATAAGIYNKVKMLWPLWARDLIKNIFLIKKKWLFTKRDISNISNWGIALKIK